MNKIYKVIWSKVKNQYVVVSELAHSNGKQSRTARKSLRSRIAALVVCGAIAAFGVFGMPDIPSAYAADGGAETQSWQYLAIGGATTDQATDWDRHWVPSWAGGGHWEYDAYYRDIEDDQGNTHRYVYTRGDDGNYYWVREGYSIDKDSGYTYTVKDTAGNTAQLTDIASATKLGEVNTQVNTNTSNITSLGNRVTVNEGDITTIKGNMITGGQGNDDGTITLTGKNGDVATVTGLHDYAIDKQDVTVKDGSVSLKVTDRYDQNNTYDVTIDGIVTDDTVATKNNLKVAAGDKGRWTITDTSKEEGSQVFTNTTLADEVETSGDKDSGYTYTVKDTAGNTAVIKDVASAEKLSSVDSKVGDTNYSSTNYIHNGDSLTEAASDLDTAIKTTANKVDAGWKATAGETSIDVKPTEDGVVPTLNFAGDKNISVTADKASSTINVELNPNLEVESVKASGDVYTTNIAGEKEYSLKDIGYNTQAIKYAGDHTAVDGILSADKIQNENRSFMVEENGNITAGKVKVYATTGEVTGLTNTTWDGTTNNVTRAATEGQLQDVVKDIETNSYKGWNVTTNGGETEANKAEVASKGNVDFSNTDENIVIGQNGTNLTFDLNDNIILGDESGTRIQLNGNPQTDSMISITNKDSDTVFNIAKDGTVHSDGDIVAKADSNKKYSLSEVGENAVRYNNEDKSTVALAGTSGTTITNVADGALNEESTEAVNGSQLYAVDKKVNAGWTAKVGDSEINVRPNGENETGKDTLSFAGDNNITVTADSENNAINVKLNPDLTLAGETKGNSIKLSGTGGYAQVVQGNTYTDIQGGTVTVGSDINGVNKKIVIDGTTGEMTGLSNTTVDYEGFATEGKAATEEQLKQAAAASKTTVSNGKNTTVTSNTDTDDGHVDYQVNLNDNVTLGTGDNQISINGAPKVNDPALSIGNKFVVEQNGTTTIIADDGINNRPGQAQLTPDTTVTIAPSGVTFAGDDKGTTIIEGQKITSGGIVINGEDIYDKTTGIVTKGTITGLSNTTWDGKTDNASRVATEGQLEDLSDTVNTGWIATDSQNHEVNITPDNNKLNFAGDENVTVTAANNEIKVALNDDIVLGDYLNGGAGVLIGGSSGTISATNSITVGEDQGLIIDGQKKEIQGLSNTTWNEDVANAVERDSVAASTAATQGQLQEVSKVANAGWTASDGTNSISVKPNETLNFVGDENLTVSADGTDKELKVSLNDDITLKGDSSSIELTGTKGTIQVNQETAEGTNFTNINGNVVSIGYTNSEGIENAIVIDGGKGTITGLSNTTWDDELAKQVANSEELQGTAATQGQLQQAVSEVAEVANAGWNAKAGGNTINVKPNETLNFEGDGNITVSATGGTSSELKFGLNHNITLDNVENEKTMMVFNTDGREGYIPDNYKEDNGQINDFIEEHGGFAIYYANPSLTTGDMTGTFGVTTDGVVHAKDVISYYSASGGSQSDVIRYSLNDVGDIVTQISHAVFDEGKGSTGMEYTLISDFEDEAEKDSPFEANEGKTRTIGLAVRQDGAVIVGAVVNDEGMSSDYGIRINAETDADGNNKATITGLENTEWKPPTPVATLAANDGSATVTSRAATESQLNDLYSAVAAYDVNVDGTIDYSHIALAGAPYGASRAGNGTPTGGTSITNVAYASGKDGSEAVNVDYLNDAISDAAENGSISTSDQHLVANTETGSNGVYKPNDDGNVNLIVSDEKGNSSTITIGDVASKTELDSLKTNVGDLSYSKVQGDDVKDGDSVTTAIGKLDNKIENISGTATDADNNTVTGGKINSDGTISLTQKDKDSIKLEGQLTDSGVVQEGTSFDKETGTITITSQDKYSGETSSVKVEGIASTEVVGATNKEDLATAYKDADKDGNATTEYITDSESMVEADVALDHAIQDVAGTSYANDMVLSNRIDSVEKRLGNVEERIDKVGAMAAAIANLRTMGFDPEAPTEIAIGVGQYKSETGIAIGVFHYPNQDFMLSASLSSSGDELMGGIGATWKLGRKSAAERAKDEEARHLEQAEEMKKLAQQEKVKAQAQRHAKLLAERQQASQKNA